MLLFLGVPLGWWGLSVSQAAILGFLGVTSCNCGGFLRQKAIFLQGALVPNFLWVSLGSQRVFVRSILPYLTEGWKTVFLERDPMEGSMPGRIPRPPNGFLSNGTIVL